MQKVKLYDFTVHYARPDGTKDSVPVSHVRDPQHAIEELAKDIPHARLKAMENFKDER